MKSTQRIRFICGLVFVLVMLIGTARAAEPSALRVAAFKVDMTPADLTGVTNFWEVKYSAVHDKIYARGIILGNDTTTAVIISIDSVEITDGTELTARIARETGIPVANIIVTATHNHNAPLFSLANASGSRKAGPAATAWINKVQDDLLVALKQAKGDMQLARVSMGSGSVDININRDVLAANGKYTLGRNVNGPTDKTVWVVKFESLSGEPIGILINYAVHSTILNLHGSLMTGELAGATSRVVEQKYNDKVVAVWTMGAAGDQAPILMSPKADDNRAFEYVDVLGEILGEEVIRVADNVKAPVAQPRIWGMEKIVTCPGQKATGKAQDQEGRTLIDADPVSFRLSVLMIDKIAITSVAAEVVTNIYQRLRRESPFTNTMMITIANGRVGYIAEDASYANPTFEVFGSPLKRGCGESSIVNGLVEMMRQY